ncbi:MAG: phasin family protein [Anaerolineae bacterium]
MGEEIKVTEEEPAQAGASLLGGLRRILMAGIGAVVVAQDEMEAFVDKLVERGEIAEKDGRTLINDLRQRRQEKAKKAEADLEKRVESMLDRVNLPNKKDMEELSAKIAALAEKVDELKKE